MPTQFKNVTHALFNSHFPGESGLNSCLFYPRVSRYLAQAFSRSTAVNSIADQILHGKSLTDSMFHYIQLSPYSWQKRRHLSGISANICC